MSEIDENHGYEEEIEYAGFWIRVGAALIDTLVFSPLIALSFVNLFYFKSLVLLYVMIVLQSLYKPLMEFRYGATLGKMAVKIRVVNENQGFITIDQAFGRYIPWVISAIISLITSTAIYTSPEFYKLTTYIELTKFSQNLPLSTVSQVYNIVFLVLICWVVIDPKKQGLHDKIARTFCIKIKK
ncbi:MAG: RDD family protein [Flavobacteriales bacterium]|nr:RDD family protein [Flavobacteriales bacterium]